MLKSRLFLSLYLVLVVYSVAAFGFDAKNLHYKYDLEKKTGSPYILAEIFERIFPVSSITQVRIPVRPLKNPQIIKYLEKEVFVDIAKAEKIASKILGRDYEFKQSIIITQFGSPEITNGNGQWLFGNKYITVQAISERHDYSLDEFKTLLFHELGHAIFHEAFQGALKSSNFFKANLEEENPSFIESLKTYFWTDWTPAYNEFFADLYSLGFRNNQSVDTLRSFKLLSKLYPEKTWRNFVKVSNVSHNIFHPIRAHLWRHYLRSALEKNGRLKFEAHVQLLKSFLSTINDKAFLELSDMYVYLTIDDWSPETHPLEANEDLLQYWNLPE